MKRSFSRRKSFGQKPWNKVSRNDKFWVPGYQIKNAAQTAQFSTLGTPAYAFYWDPFVEATGQVASFNFIAKGLSRVKIHRIQGFQKLIGTWGGAATLAPPYPPPMMALDYAWMVLDKLADTHDAMPPVPSSFSPSAYSSGDLYELLQRDDLLSWGSVDVPRHNAYSNIGPSWAVADYGQVSRRALLPFPRIGKMGLNLPRGKALCCIVAGRSVTDGQAGFAIDDGLDTLAGYINLEATYRLLCS